MGPDASMQPPNAQRLPILLVSESTTERVQLERVFPDRLTAVADAEVALDAVRRQTFAAILLDLALRGRDAVELLRELRATGNAAPVLVLAEEADEAIAASALRHGAAGCVAKRVGFERALAVLVEVGSDAGEEIGSVEPAAAGEGGWPLDLLVFEVEGQRHAVPVSAVREILPALTVTPLPGAPLGVEGLIDLRGRLLPVLDIRPLLGLAPREIGYTDHLIVAEAGARLLAIRADRAIDIARVSASQLDDTRGKNGPGRVARLLDGLVFIHDPRALLSAASVLSAPSGPAAGAA